MRWFGQDSELEVGGFKLNGPCVYASSDVDNGYLRASDPSEILLHAPVRRPHDAMSEMRYWPWYARIEPEHRFEYLSWLSANRSSLPPNDGYLFLYFYGIERRLLVDEADRTWGLQEIVRLRKLDEPRRATSEGRSFRNYSTGLLWFEIARTPNLFDASAFGLVERLTERWTPELLTAPLAWLVAKERPLPASIARQIAAADPAAQRSVVTKRVPEEFNELFETRYLDAFGGEGVSLRVSKRQAWHTYRPASGGLEEARMRVPNPMGIKSQFKKLPDLWNSCVADLRKLSRVSGSVDGETLSVDAWEAMPEELRVDVDHPLTGSVVEILTQDTGDDTSEDDGAGVTATAMVPAGHFAEMIGIERRPKLTATQSRKVATTLEHTGYGIVPDARITPIRYGWDDPIAVLPGLDDDEVDSRRPTSTTSSVKTARSEVCRPNSLNGCFEHWARPTSSNRARMASSFSGSSVSGCARGKTSTPPLHQRSNTPCSPLGACSGHCPLPGSPKTAITSCLRPEAGRSAVSITIATRSMSSPPAVGNARCS
ncbi:MAG: TerB N-terminal domain-containing protein [Planctomycetota bacterium]